jgi:hypothetical protein
MVAASTRMSPPHGDMRIRTSEWLTLERLANTAPLWKSAIGPDDTCGAAAPATTSRYRPT